MAPATPCNQIEKRLSRHYNKPAGAAPAFADAAASTSSGSSSGKLNGKVSSPVIKDESGAWFVRLIAEAGTMRDRSNVLGQLGNSVDGLDSNDIEELTPFGYRRGQYLSLTFENENFPLTGWGYTSDYRGMTKKQTALGIIEKQKTPADKG